MAVLHLCRQFQHVYHIGDLLGKVCPDVFTHHLEDLTPQGHGVHHSAVLPAWLSPGSPLRGHRRVSHADGHAVFKVQQAKRKQKSRHKTDQPCLRFFWKVMLVGYVTAESQNVQPRRV